MWQINTCFQFDKFVSYLENLMDTSPNHIIQMPINEHYFTNKEIPEDFYKKLKVQERFYSGFGIVHQSILLNEENKIYKIIVPKDDKQWLFDFEINSHYQELQTTQFYHNKKEYINLTQMVKYIKKYKKLKNKKIAKVTKLPLRKVSKGTK